MVIYWRLSKIIWHKQFHDHIFCQRNGSYCGSWRGQCGFTFNNLYIIWVDAEECECIAMLMWKITIWHHIVGYPILWGKPDCGFQFKGFKLPNWEFRVTWKSTAAKAWIFRCSRNNFEIMCRDYNLVRGSTNHFFPLPSGVHILSSRGVSRCHWVVLLTCLTTLLVSACYDGYYLHISVFKNKDKI